MVGRSEHYSVIRSKGLNIITPSGKEFIHKPDFLPMLERIPQDVVFDWIFLTVKSYDLKKAIAELKRIIDRNRNVKFLLFQRGVGSHELLKGLIPDDRIYLAAQTINVAILEFGTVVQTNQAGAVCIAPLKLRNDLHDALDLFSGSGIETLDFKDWKSMKWSSLLYEMLTDGLCALSDYKPDRLFSYGLLVKMETDAFREGVKVVTKLGLDIINLPAYNVKNMVFLSSLPDFIGKVFIKKELLSPKNVRVSTIKNDMGKAKHNSEIPYINGAISRWGKEWGVKTPVNDFISSELMKIVTGKLSWEVYRHKPDEIFACFKIFKLNH